MGERAADTSPWCDELRLTREWDGKNDDFYRPESVKRLALLWHASNFHAPTYGVALELHPIPLERAVITLRAHGRFEQAERLSKHRTRG